MEHPDELDSNRVAEKKNPLSPNGVKQPEIPAASIKSNLYINSDEELHANLARYGLKQKEVFFTLMLCLLVDIFGFSLTLPLMPTIGRTFGANDFMIGVLTASNAFTTMIFGPIWGRLSDKYGRRPIMLICQIGTLTSFVLLASSNSLYMVLATRLLDGVFGGQLPVIQAILSDITTPKSRPEKMAKFSATFSTAFLLGPSLGGLLGALSWRLPPTFTSILAIISIFLTLSLLKETMPKERRSDIIEEKKAKNIGHGTILTPVVLLRLSQIFFNQAVFGLYVSSSALILTDRYGLSLMYTGLMMSGMSIFMMLFGAVLMKPLLNKVGKKTQMNMALVSSFFAWLLFILFDHLAVFFFFLICLTFFAANIRPNIITNITLAVDAGRQGEAHGWISNMHSVGDTLMPLISTAILEFGLMLVGGYGLSQYTLLGIIAMGFAAMLTLEITYDIKRNPELF